MSTKAHSIFDKSILVPAVANAFRKLSPRGMVRNPVMFVTLIGAIVTTVELAAAPFAWPTSSIYSTDRYLAVVYRVVRQFCRSNGRRTGQGTGRNTA